MGKVWQCAIFALGEFTKAHHQTGSGCKRQSVNGARMIEMISENRMDKEKPVTDESVAGSLDAQDSCFFGRI